MGFNAGSQTRVLLSGNIEGVGIQSDGTFWWSNSATTADVGFGSQDTGLSRTAAGVIGVGTGAQGSTAGTLSAASVTLGTSLTAATTTLFNASGTLTNVPMNFKDLNLFLTAAGMQGWCANCTAASVVDQTCVSGGTGALAVRDGGGVFRCIS